MKRSRGGGEERERETLEKKGYQRREREEEYGTRRCLKIKKETEIREEKQRLLLVPSEAVRHCRRHGNQPLAEAEDCGKVLVASQLDEDGNKSVLAVSLFFFILCHVHFLPLLPVCFSPPLRHNVFFFFLSPSITLFTADSHHKAAQPPVGLEN